MKSLVSIVVPVWNEAENIRPLVESIDQALQSIQTPYEVIFIDDFSTDNSKEKIESLAGTFPVRVYTKVGKRGKALSLLQGFNKAHGEILVMIDGDMQYPADAIPAMIAKIESGSDVVTTQRIQHNESLLRRLASKVFLFLFIRILHGLKFDSQSGLKAFTQQARVAFPERPTQWSFDLEFLLNAKRLGFSIDSVPISFAKREAGESKIHVFQATRELAMNAVSLRFRFWAVSASRLPLLRHIVTLFRDKPVTPFSEAELLEKGKGFHYNGKELVHHSGLSHQDTAHLVITGKQKFMLTVLIAALALCLILNWHLTVLVLFAALTVLYFIDLVFNFFLIFRTFAINPAIKVTPQTIAKVPDSAWPTYTIFCPLYKEWQVVPQFIDAMSKLDYPKDKLQVMLLLEQDDVQTIAKTKEFNLPDYFDVVVVPHSFPKTKPKAMNYGLQYATGEFLVIYDAEDVPESQQLKKAVLAFKKLPENVVCVQAKLNFYNPDQNLLTRLFTAEYSLWFDLVLTGLQSLNGPIPLGGTSNHFRTKDLHILKGWDAFNVTEDCDLGIRLFKQGYRTAIVESTTLEEANSDLKNWYHQRSRWIKGYIQTYLVHMRRPGEFLDDLKRPHVLTFQLNVGGKILSMFINPLMWMITIIYFAFRVQAGPFIESFFPSFILYIGVFSFIFGNFLYLYYYLIGCAKRGQFGLIKYALLVPFYWLGMSIAAWRAVYEIIRKPHYWAKTVHGLHLQKEEVADVSVAVPAMTDTETILVPEGTPVAASFASANNATVTAEVVAFVADDQTAVTVGRIQVLRQKIAKFRNSPVSDGTVFVASVVIGNFLNFVFNAFLGRELKLDDFATVTLFGTVLGLVSIILSAVSSAVNFRAAFLFGKNAHADAALFTKRAYRLWLWISGIGTLIWLGLSPIIAKFFQIDQMYLVMLFSPVILFGTIASVATGYLRGKFLFAIVGRAIIIEAITKLVAATVLVLVGFPKLVSLSIPASIIVSFIASVLYARTAMRQDEAEPVSPNAYSFPVSFFRASLLSNAAAAVFLNVDVLLAKHYLSPDDAGSYSLLSLVGKMVFFFGSLLSAFITSLVSRHEGAQTNPARDFYRLFNGTVLFTGVAFLGAGVFGNFTIPILFGESAQSILPHLITYTAAMSVYTLTSVLVSYHVAKKEYEFSWIALASAFLVVFGIMWKHGSIAELSTALLLVSVVQFVVVFGWHAIRKNTRFILRTLTDFLDVFVPLKGSTTAIPGKRILIFNWRDTKHAFAGGAEVYIHELAKRWVESGNEVTVFCGNDGASSRNDVVDGVHIVRRGGFYFVYAWAFIYYMFQFRGKFDVVIDCQNGIPFFTPLYVKEPVYCLMHHVHQEVFRKYLSAPLAFVARILESRAMPIVYRDTQFITISDSSKTEMESLGLGLAGMEIVHPGVNLTDLIPGVKDPEPLVLYLGRLKAYKSVDVLIRAFEKVLQRIPNARLVVAGSGEEQQVLHNLTKDMALEHRVTFTGKITEAEKISWLQRAWVFVNPSMMEGWGITSIEANACGVPVVASDVPGLRDSVNNPHTGYLVAHGDVDTFAERIIRLLDHEDLRNFMSKESIEWASNFSWDVSAAKLLEVIHE